MKTEGGMKWEEEKRERANSCDFFLLTVIMTARLSHITQKNAQETPSTSTQSSPTGSITSSCWRVLLGTPHN